jgi:hypothetical protein
MNSFVILSRRFLRSEEPVPGWSRESAGSRIHGALPERAQATEGCVPLASLSLSRALEMSNHCLCQR